MKQWVSTGFRAGFGPAVQGARFTSGTRMMLDRQV
jgi:hypothetical protein